MSDKPAEKPVNAPSWAELPEPLPKKIFAAWEQAGAAVGWLRLRPYQW